MYESNVSTKKYILINLNIYCHTLIWLGPMNLLKITPPPPSLIAILILSPFWCLTPVHINKHKLLWSFNNFYYLLYKSAISRICCHFLFSFERYYLYTTMCLSTVWCTMYFLCIIYRYIVLWSVTFISDIVGYFDFNKPWLHF